MMTKTQLRELYKQKRQQLSPGEKDKLEDLMLIQFQKLSFEIPTVIMTYAPCERLQEYDPSLAERFSSFRNPFTIFAYPTTRENNIMKAVAVDEETTFQPNTFGIAEPVNGNPMLSKAIDLVFVPLLAFDENGFRVGYGKGYYDRFLKTCREDVVKIGFSFFAPVPSIADLNKYDVPIDMCVTPDRTYTFIQ